jgi:glucosamine-6-phosphate deaminase
MKITICNNARELGLEAAKLAGSRLREAIEEKGKAKLILSTGNSQFETLDSLLREKVDWKNIEIFHLDEYIGLQESHKASFRKYLKERFINRIDCKMFHAVDTEGNIEELMSLLSHKIQLSPVDVGLIGIGVNGHIAFNDPPADFETVRSFIEVTLDEKCRQQQVDEGWFARLDEVPEKAVSMSVNQIMQCRTIISAVPHNVKAEAVYNTFTNQLTNMVPATMLKYHPDFNLFLDVNSASRIIAL